MRKLQKYSMLDLSAYEGCDYISTDQYELVQRRTLVLSHAQNMGKDESYVTCCLHAPMKRDFAHIR